MLNTSNHNDSGEFGFNTNNGNPHFNDNDNDMQFPHISHLKNAFGTEDLEKGNGHRVYYNNESQSKKTIKV